MLNFIRLLRFSFTFGKCVASRNPASGFQCCVVKTGFSLRRCQIGGRLKIKAAINSRDCQPARVDLNLDSGSDK